MTGGAGYIGSHVCKALSEYGFTPITLDNLSTGNREAVKWGRLIECDIRDTRKIKSILTTENPVAVLHFAASAYVGESVTDPQTYYENNVVGTLSLLSAMTAAGVKELVFSSSCATFGTPDGELIDETHPQVPINPYGQTKLICETAIKDYAKVGGIRYAILRYFNAAGADASCDIGESHNPETHVIPLAIHAALSNGVFNLNGVDLNTPDGTAVRDYIHVTDLASGHVASLTRLINKQESFDLNLGSGTGVSVKNLIDEIQKICGVKMNVRESVRRVGDPDYLVADISKAKSYLSWNPKNSSLENIVKTALAWYGEKKF